LGSPESPLSECEIMMSRRNLLVVFNLIGSIVLVILFVYQYSKFNLLGTRVLLGGWDTPFYAWHARVEVQYGPGYMMGFWHYPQLYTQLLALLGYAVGDVIVVQRVLPLVLGAIHVVLLSLISFRISNRVSAGALTAVIAPLSIGTLWFVSEFHRNQLALLFIFAVFLHGSNPKVRFNLREYLILTMLLFLVASTQFETFVLGSATLIVASAVMRNRKKTLLFGLSTASASVILLAMFPDFLNIYYLNPLQHSFNLPSNLGYADLVFWSLGSFVLLPFAILGVAALYRYFKLQQSLLAVIILVFFLSLAGLGIVLLYTAVAGLAIRVMLLIPVPIILALGISESIRLAWRLRLRRRSELSTDQGRQEIRFTRVAGALLLSVTIASLALTSNAAMDKVVISYVQVDAHSKIITLSRYLSSSSLAAPVIMFHGSSLWVADQYRAYLGIEIGEHLAYYGDLQNLSALVPTISSFPYPTGAIADFTSVKYLSDMLGNKRFLIFPQQSFVRDYSDLRLHPIVFISPEVYDAPVPPYVVQYQISDGIYVVPSLALIEELIRPHSPATS